MVMTNGMVPHGHQIYNFHATDHRATDNLIAINGNATFTAGTGRCRTRRYASRFSTGP